MWLGVAATIGRWSFWTAVTYRLGIGDWGLGIGDWGLAKRAGGLLRPGHPLSCSNEATLPHRKSMRFLRDVSLHST